MLKSSFFAVFIILSSCAPPEANSLSVGTDAIFDEFSGRYFLTDDLGQAPYEIYLLRDQTFRVERDEAAGTRVQITGSMILNSLGIELFPAPGSPSLDASAFLLVRWGSRRYLIEVTRKNEFCDSIMLGDEPRNGGVGKFFMREGGWGLQANDPPTSLHGVPVCLMD